MFYLCVKRIFTNRIRLNKISEVGDCRHTNIVSMIVVELLRFLTTRAKREINCTGISTRRRKID